MTPEQHTLKELCEDLFTIRTELAVDLGRKVSQELIDNLPQMVWLANEKRIIAMGLNPKIDIKFRLQVAQNESLSHLIEEGMYYAALDGSSFDIRLS